MKFKQKIRSYKRELLYLSGLSRPKRLLFDHLPKCGGTSLSSYLVSCYPKSKVFITNGLNPHESVKYFKELDQNIRYSYGLLIGHGTHKLIDSVHPKTFVTTILREPVERVISLYYYILRESKHYLHKQVVNYNINLQEFVSSDLYLPLRNYYTSHFSGLTQLDIEQKTLYAVEKATHNLMQRYNLVGLLDCYEVFMTELLRRANLKFPYRYSKLNVTENRPNSQNISTSTLKKIKEMNYADIEFFKKAKIICVSESLHT